MSRKSILPNKKVLDEAVDNWKAVTEIRGEMAKEAWDYQDEETQKVLNRILNRLRLGTNGDTAVKVGRSYVPVRMPQEYIDYNLMFIAIEILKDLRLFDIQIANFKFPPSLCAKCGATLELEVVKKKRGRK